MVEAITNAVYNSHKNPAFEISDGDISPITEKLKECVINTYNQGRIQEFPKGGGPVPSPPLPFSPFPPPSPSPPVPSPFSPVFSPPLPLRSRAPLVQLGVLGERCKLPQRGPGQSPGRKRSPGATGRLWEAKPPQCVTQASPDSEAYATKI